MKKAAETAAPKSKNTSLQLDPSTIAPTKLDQDPRYRSALISIFESAAHGVSVAAQTVYHGRFDILNQYPDVVLLLGPKDQICSGVIIASGVVLTALHCICDGFDTKVGVPNNAGDLDVKPTVNVPLQMKVCNKVGPADIGIVFVPPSLHPTAGQPRFATSAQLSAAKMGIIVGFGNTDVGRTGASHGKRGYGGVAIVTPRCSATDIQFGCNPAYEFFAGPTSDAKSSLSSDECHGDSGGPMYIDTADGSAIAGIASRPDAQSFAAGCGQGGIYERIDGDAGAWIASVIAQKRS
ncbi:hypothetical protein B0E50_09445 [Rhodanobacter sp. C01]|nr:hypothetical protein B0E50_09445 [Rhodanobacter sp. C01]